MIREDRDDNRPYPFVKNFDSKGVMTIGWTHKLIRPEDYMDIPETKFTVTGSPRKLQNADEIKVVNIVESEQEYEKFIRKILELEAMEVKFVSGENEKVEIGFTWDIRSYNSDEIKLQFTFENPSEIT